MKFSSEPAGGQLIHLPNFQLTSSQNNLSIQPCSPLKGLGSSEVGDFSAPEKEWWDIQDNPQEKHASFAPTGNDVRNLPH